MKFRNDELSIALFKMIVLRIQKESIFFGYKFGGNCLHFIERKLRKTFFLIKIKSILLYYRANINEVRKASHDSVSRHKVMTRHRI